MKLLVVVLLPMVVLASWPQKIGTWADENWQADKAANIPLDSVTPYGLQTAGHGIGEKEHGGTWKEWEGLLQIKDTDYVLKPLQHCFGEADKVPDDQKNKGMREVYCLDQMSKNKSHPLYPFVPESGGLCKVDGIPTGPDGETKTGYYLKMKDFNANYSKPCILDVKVGGSIFRPFDSEERILDKWRNQRDFNMRKFKFMPDGYIMSHVLGKVENKGMKNFARNPKMSDEAALKQFFTDFFQHSPKAMDGVVEQIGQVKDVFEKKLGFHFYSASLLFIYDAEGDPKPQVKLIDFCHAFTEEEFKTKVHQKISDLVDHAKKDRKDQGKMSTVMAMNALKWIAAIVKWTSLENILKQNNNNPQAIVVPTLDEAWHKIDNNCLTGVTSLEKYLKEAKQLRNKSKFSKLSKLEIALAFVTALLATLLISAVVYVINIRRAIPNRRESVIDSDSEELEAGPPGAEDLEAPKGFLKDARANLALQV